MDFKKSLEQKTYIPYLYWQINMFKKNYYLILILIILFSLIIVNFSVGVTIGADGEPDPNYTPPSSESSNDENPNNGDPNDKPSNNGASDVNTNECRINSDCDINSCSETYQEICEESYLVEYEGYENGILDSVTINDECQKTCVSGKCIDCNVDCSANTVQTCSVDCGSDCSDLNTINGDGCSSECKIEYCGDGIINNLIEECDDSNNIKRDGCYNCKIEYGWKASNDNPN